jgi:hypothetical protein
MTAPGPGAGSPQPLPGSGRAHPDVPHVSAGWLGLREPADAAARASELVEQVRRHLAGTPRVVIHDLGSGTGSMGRWLAPRLPGPQHWIMYDRDADLLETAVADMVDAAADGAPVTVEARQRDITRLTADDLDGAGMITASALLDMLTADEVERVVAACAGAGCPTLLTLSVIGQVELTPVDPLDAEIAEAFSRRGVNVLTRPSPWRLGPGQAELTSEWLGGWLAAACEQRPELAGPVAAYADRRLADAAAGRLEVVVGHHDLLAGCV